MTTKPFDGRKKCTYIYTISTKDTSSTLTGTTYAPGFKLSKADWTKFQLHFLEWADVRTSGLATDNPDHLKIQRVTPANTVPGYYGTYNEYYPSPIKGSNNYPNQCHSSPCTGWAAYTVGGASQTGKICNKGVTNEVDPTGGWTMQTSGAG